MLRQASSEQAAAINKLNKTIGGYDGPDVIKGDDIYVKDTDLSLRKSDKDVADPLIQIREDNSTLLDNLYGFEDAKGASDFFKDRTYNKQTITDVKFNKGAGPGANKVTITYITGKVTETDPITKEKNIVDITSESTFDLNNPLRVDTLLENLLKGNYTPTQISKKKADLKKQARQRIAIKYE